MLYEEIQEAIAFIRSQTAFQPRSGIVLGTGLGSLVEEVETVAVIDYADIPHFASSTVESHHGKLVFGTLAGHPVVVMAGRFHWYEGWTMAQVVFPIRVMKFLGIERLVITNVSGGINPHLHPGDIVVVRDHLNLMPDNPLRGVNDTRVGPRFPDLLHTYDAELRKSALSIAQAHGIRAIEGVYSALSGPNLETPAEYDMLHRLGSDCTGMSSVPEVLAARHMNLPVAMLSLVSNVSYPPAVIRETTLAEVIAVAREAEPKMRTIIKEMLTTL
jgi:purine-nucleoside phosphorylase